MFFRNTSQSHKYKVTVTRKPGFDEDLFDISVRYFKTGQSVDIADVSGVSLSEFQAKLSMLKLSGRVDAGTFQVEHIDISQEPKDDAQKGILDIVYTANQMTAFE